MQNIVVTGIGIVSSIGMNKEEVWNSLTEKKSGVGPVSVLATRHKNEFVSGEIKKTHGQLLALAGVNEKEFPWTRTALLGYLAARQALEDAGGEGEDPATGLVSASTVGGMDRSELYYREFLSGTGHQQYIDSHHAGNSTEMIAMHLHLKGYITTISTACSSSLNSIIHAVRLIRHGLANRVLAGGTDALSAFTLNGFNSLMILDRELCKPFDAERNGLNLGEGAAYLMLEKEEDALRRGRKIYAVVKGFGNANDANHQTATSARGDGPFLSMKKALEEAEIKPSEVGYINVHGTGTPNNDLTESRAMMRLFGKDIPPFSSTKAFTGHTLGAAGAVESVFSVLALNNGYLLPNINFKTPIPETGLVPETKGRTVHDLNHVLTNSFGFGGNDSSLLFSKYKAE